MHELFVNSLPCDTVAYMACDEWQGDSRYRSYFEAIAKRYYLPIINDMLPKGCELSFSRMVVYGDHWELVTKANEKLLKAIEAANKKDKWRTFNQMKANKKSFDGMALIPYDLDNDESLKFKAFLSILGFDIDSDELQDSLFDETRESYYQNGSSDGLDYYIEENKSKTKES